MSKIIGKGKYGKVYRPPLKCMCHTSWTSSFVSKQTTMKYAKKEFENSKLMVPIDPRQQFHVGVEHICFSIEEPVDNSNVLLFFRYGGKELHSYIDRGHINDLRRFISGLRNVMYGIFKMNSNDYYHLDIKTNNIVYKHTMRLIDFGHSQVIENPAEYRSQRFLRHYTYLPPEAIVLAPEKQTPEKIASYVYMYMNDSHVLEHHSLLTSHNIDTPTYQDILNTIYDVQEQDGQEHTVRKLDSYAMGMTLIKILLYIDDMKQLTCYTELLQLALDMTHINPINRTGSKDAYQRIIRLRKT